MNRYRHMIVCPGPGYQEEAQSLRDKLELLLLQENLADQIKIVLAHEAAYNGEKIAIWCYPEQIFYVRVGLQDAENLVYEYAIGEKILKPLLENEADKAKSPNFLHRQVRIALRNCGKINPDSLEDYIQMRGYEALGKVLTAYTPTDVVKTVKDSGLRGKGGGGFPTGLKWEFTAASKASEKYIICNADEGDPGAFMDRSILEGDPHSVLEAMAIAGYAIGASRGIIYIRAEYPLAVRRLQESIAQAEAVGLLGNNIFDTEFSFQISLSLGAGAFVCGEETALMNSVEGNRGEPLGKPPFPAQKGLYGQPTCINNVETLASICPIILEGAEWFAGIGTDRSKGTKVFALAGNINQVGLAEVPMGTTVREIVYDIGGGLRGGASLKAVQTGGPSGGCIPASLIDTPIDFESLQAIGSMMGSGGMIVMDENDCMVNIARFFLEFTVDESCGKCTPCRIGNRRLFEMLTEITEGKGTREELIKLKELGEIIKDCSLCGLGQAAPNPVLSTLRYFYDEYRVHVVEKKCPASVCTHLVTFTIDAEKCIGCTLCAIHCPVRAVDGERRGVHLINQSKCIKCGLCRQKCPIQAINKE